MLIKFATRTLQLSLLIFPSLNALSGQITHTAAFTKILQRAGIEYAEPLEQFLHVTVPPQHEFMNYDLVLQNDRNDFEVRYNIHANPRADMTIPATVAVSRLVSSIASNDELNDILIRIPPEEFLLGVFNAHRGVIAYFTPKGEFSEKPHGVLLSLFAIDRPAIDIVILYTDPSYDALTSYRSIRYKDLR